MVKVKLDHELIHPNNVLLHTNLIKVNMAKFLKDVDYLIRDASSYSHSAIRYS